MPGPSPVPNMVEQRPEQIAAGSDLSGCLRMYVFVVRPLRGSRSDWNCASVGALGTVNSPTTGRSAISTSFC